MRSISKKKKNSKKYSKNLDSIDEESEFFYKFHKNYRKFEHLIFSNSSPKETKSYLLKSIKGIIINNLKRSLLFKKSIRLVIYKKKLNIRQVNNGIIEIPQKDFNKKKTLFLDLDETILHKTYKNNYSLDKIELVSGNKRIYINIRPYCFYFLNQISTKYEIYIYTSSSKEYSETIVNAIDPDGKIISGILNRDACCITMWNYYIKDLKLIKNRSLNEMVLVDNSTFSFGTSIDNCIPIIDFKNDEKDKELLYLSDFLLEIAEKENIRIPIIEKYNLQGKLKEIIN